MKKLLSMALVLVMILSTLSMFATGAFAAADKWDGKTANIKWYADNTSANEFTVTTAADLFGLSVICFSVDSNACVYNGDKKVYYEDNGNVIFDATKITAETKNVPSSKFAGKTVKLAGDIDLDSKPFIPIGSTGSFQGMFDGQNHSISNVVINADNAEHKAFKGKQYYYALFALIAGGTAGVKNLTIKNEVLNVEIIDSATNIWAGGITGQAHANGCEVSNVKVEGLTINITGTGNPTFTLFNVGAFYGTYNTSKAQTNIVVTDYLINNETTQTPSVTDDMYYGKAGGTGTGTFTGCSVTVKQASSGGNDDAGTTNPGTTPDNPETGDMTLVLVALAAISAVSAGAVLTLKKREER